MNRAVSDSLLMLCDFNGAVGAAFRVADGRLTLVAPTPSVDQDFLDAAQLLWRSREADVDLSLAAANGHLFLFSAPPAGVVVLSSLNEGRCSVAIREYLLGAIGDEIDKAERTLQPSLTISMLATVSDDELKRQRLIAVLESCGWVIERAARREGCTGRTIRNRMKTLGIQRPSS